MSESSGRSCPSVHPTLAVGVLKGRSLSHQESEFIPCDSRPLDGSLIAGRNPKGFHTSLRNFRPPTGILNTPLSHSIISSASSPPIVRGPPIIHCDALHASEILATSPRAIVVAHKSCGGILEVSLPECVHYGGVQLTNANRGRSLFIADSIGNDLSQEDLKARVRPYQSLERMGALRQQIIHNQTP